MTQVSDQGNAVQSTRLSFLNDRYGVARWAMEDRDLHVWCDDGDEAMVHRDGTVTWLSISGEGAS